MLPKARRLSKSRDFDRVFSHGRVLDCPPIRLIWAPGNGRAAVVASRNLGSIARRNRIRRRWREGLRTLMEEIPDNLDLIVVVKREGAETRGDVLLSELRSATRKLAKCGC
ncbi:MAG: ribonuclease P protein component [Armatimonadetes bacterium]|nr:ribonuclease P protein component [Armatimonadota bacterium]